MIRWKTHAWRPAAAAAALCAFGAANAAVGSGGLTLEANGGTSAPFAYGTADAGLVNQIATKLFVSGLSANAGDPDAVTALTSALSFDFTVSGAGTSLMTIDYNIRNVSASETFNTLRFLFFVDPDGSAAANRDTATETWGVGGGGEPNAREAREFDNIDSIVNNFVANNNLTETPSPIDTCLAAAGCDATVGLQWNAAQLDPGQFFSVRVGLSDTGQAVSARFIDVTSLDAPNTALRISGMASVVPEPGLAWLLAAGLGVVGAVARRRRDGGGHNGLRV